jgi:hypothetical protein
MARVLVLLFVVALALPFPVHAVTQLQENLVLVYLDAFRGDGVEVRVAAADGTNPRTVATYPRGTRSLGLNGPLMALADGDDLVVLDLRSGAERRVAFPGVSGALIGEGAVVLATARGRCAGALDDALLLRLDLTTGEAVTLTVRGLDLLRLDAVSGEVWVAPRGCDPGLSAVWALDVHTGQHRRSITVEGCGTVALSPDGRYTATTWSVCTRPEGREQAVASIYGLAGESGPSDLLVAEPELWAGGFRFAPDSRRVAYALNVPRRLAAERSDILGVWLLDLETRRHERVLHTGGLETLPVSWSPDGRYLLVSVVLAQGLCGYTILDTVTGTELPVAGELGVCGVNGEVAGWTVLD